MSVYDRNMFRGSRPTDQPVKQAEQMLMKKAGEKVMSDAMGGIAAAKDPVELMNAMRGDERTMKERRQELGGIVGMKDANKTPESVVTLVQPVMQMREAQAPVDQGIGQIAQRAMDTPVTKEMTQGIVQKFSNGGQAQTITQPLMNAIQQGMAGGRGKAAPSSPKLMDFYNKNLELARQIYGGDEEADRKQALANLLLGGLAPAGLQIAQGVPVAEALMPIGPLLATSGASVREAKNKREAAAKAAALDMASDQYTASQKIEAVNPEYDVFRGGIKIQDGTPKPQKPLGAGTTKDYRYEGKEPADIPGVGTIQPGQTFPIGGNELNTVFKSIRTQLKEVKDPPKPQAAGAQAEYKYEGEEPLTLPGIGTINPGDEISLGSNELSSLGTSRTLFKLVKEDTSPITSDLIASEPVTIGGKVYNAGDAIPPMSTDELKTLKTRRTSLVSRTNYDRGKLSTPKAMFKIGDDGKREEKIAFTEGDLNNFNAQGFSTITPEDFVTTVLVKPKADGTGFEKKYAKTPDEYNQFIQQDFFPFNKDMIKTLGNKAVALFPTGSVIVASNFDPLPMFNEAGEMKLVKNDAEMLAALNPDQTGGAYYLPEKPSKDVTKKNAYANIQPLALKLDAWASGQDQEWTPQMQMDFDTNLAAIQSSSVLVPNPDGSGGVVVQKNAVPDYVIGAIAKARQKDPNFSDYGLLPPQTDPFESVVARFKKPNIILSAEESGVNMEDAIGFTDWMGRTLVDGGFGVLVEAFGGNFIPKNPESAEAVESMNYLMNQTKTAALKELAGKDSEGLRREISSLLFNPGSPFLTTQKVRLNSEKMTARLQDAIDLKKSALADPLTSQDRVERLKDSIRELTQLQSNWSQLADNFGLTGQKQGSANQLRRNTQPLGDF
tara:strand:- start:2468 stop:5140 length:2673 start_codon:yes stop_codon:yes gene_type:complete